jgi:hypothetical protein
MSTAPRDLLVFVHLFKNAGTSVTSQLRRRFGPDGLLHLNAGMKDGKGFPARLREGLAPPEVKAVAGHFAYSFVSPALAKIGDINPTYFAFIRHPLDRLVSAYTYHLSNPETQYHSVAFENDLAGYLTFMMGMKDGKMLNYQCRMVSADGTGSFEAAKQSLAANFAYVGLVDDIAGRNDLAQEKLGLTFDAAVRANSAPRSQDTNTLSPDDWDKFKPLFDEDLKLYDHVKSAR